MKVTNNTKLSILIDEKLWPPGAEMEVSDKLGKELEQAGYIKEARPLKKNSKKERGDKK